MAQRYAMPPDTNEEENIVGGIINKHQLIWLVVGGGAGAFITLILFKFIGAISLIFAFPPVAVGCVFAFHKIENMMLFDYLRYKHRYNASTKHFANFGNHSELNIVIKEDGEDSNND